MEKRESAFIECRKKSVRTENIVTMEFIPWEKAAISNKQISK